MNIMTRIFVASMVTPCWLLAGTQLAVAAQPVAGQPVISQPVTVTWTQIKSNSAMVPALLKVPQVDTPFMPAPAEIQISSYPATPLAPAGSARPAQALLPGPVSAAVQLSAPVPLAGRALAPALGSSFLGLGDNGRSIPPDTMGAVGPRHVMTMINSQVRIQNRAGVIISTVSSSAFWAGSGPESPFDPHVVYDTLSSRWIATCDAASRSVNSKVFFAISATSVPTGAWTFYSFVADAAGTNWADYPGFGVNAKWIAISNNMFSVARNVFNGTKMWVIDKSSALAGGVLTTAVFPTAFTTGFTLKPAVTFDAAEPNLYIVNNGLSSGGGVNDFFRLSRLTGTAAAPLWSNVPDAAGPFQGTGAVNAVQRYNRNQVDAAQLGSAKLINSNDPRVMNAVFRNGHLWFAHSGGFPNEPAVATRTDMFWYEVNPRLLNTTGAALIQSGTAFVSATANAGVLFPTVAVNKFNDAAFGFTMVDSSINASAWVVGRKSTDPAGATTSAFSFAVKAGLAPYFKIFGGTLNRWGDYSATMADPLNNGAFWTLQEYADMPVGAGANKDRWGTWWAQVKMGRASLPVNDFNGDGKSDILFHQASTGKNLMMQMNGKSVLTQGIVRGFAPSWSVAGIADYNGDGKADMLFHQASTGRNFMVLMNGRAVLSQGFVRGFPASWAVVGSGDYNGDGKADMLFHQASTGRNFMVFMNGKAVLSQGFVRSFGRTWSVAGSADYNGDGKADMLFHQASTGRNFMVFMNGRAVISQGFVRSLRRTWSVAGSADYNGDGKADMLFHHASTGRNFMVLMNGRAVLSQGFVRSFAPTWSVAGSADYNGDGKADMLFHQASTGGNFMVLMNGKAVLSQGSVRGFAPSWAVVNTQ